MKKILSILLALCMILLTAQCAFAVDGESNEIAIDGSWSILMPETCSQQENYAIDTLYNKLYEVLGCYLPKKTTANEKFIAIDIPYDGIADIEDNGYAIKADENKIYINGTGVRGTLYGVNRFLEDFCGYKVYTSTLTVLPKADCIKVPADTNIVYAPFFEYTETDWRSPRDWNYSVANGLTGGSYRQLPANMGGTVNYLGGLCHTFTSTFCNADKYFGEHPEYFAFRDGERIKDQLCLTNPDTLEVVKNEVLDLLKAQHDPNASLQIISLTQADNQKYCQCDNCKAFEKAHGGVQSATMINFVNQVADVVKAAGYDNVAIDTFAYQYTRKAPTGIAPRDNMIVRLCTIECCFSHTLDDPKCKENVDLMKDLEDWSKICNRIYVWDYTTNYAHTCCLFPDFGVIQKNVQLFYEHNVKGVYEEGNYYIDACDAEFGELRAYMLSKCMQNPYCDIDKEVDGFLNAYYGNGGRYIRNIIDICTENAGDISGHLKIYQDSKINITLKPYQVAQIDKYWEAAKKSTEDETQLQNIERSELSWRYWKASGNRGEFCLVNTERFDELEKLHKDVVASGVKMLSEGQQWGDYLDCGLTRYAKPDKWHFYEVDEYGTKELNDLGKIWEVATKVLTAFGGFYKIFRAFQSINPKIIDPQ